MKKIAISSNSLFFILLSLLLSFEAYSQTTQTFTTSGTFTVPAGVTEITVEAWGAGGAGGGTSVDNTRGGGGGGGGAYARSTFTGLIPGTNYTVTVGGTTIGTFGAGETGNPSWFGSTTTLYAPGGAGGSAPNNGTVSGGAGGVASIYGQFTFSGGNGASGTTTISGGGGGGAGSTGNGNNASGTTRGNGATIGGGNGGTGRNNSGGNGAGGSTFGGGGSGAYVNNTTNRSGGNGAAGRVLVTYVTPEIEVRGNGLEITNGDATPSTTDHTDFSYVAVSTTASRTFTINNISNASTILTISDNGTGITFSSNPSGYFSIATQPAQNSTIVGGASGLTFTVNYNPLAVGTHTAIVRIDNTDSTGGEDPYTFTISGISENPTPDIDITGNGIFIIGNATNTPILIDNTDFGTAQITSETITKTFVINNSRTGNLTLGSISLGGSTNFTIVSDPSGAVIPVGGTANIVISFNSPTIGIQNDVLTILSNDPDEASYQINLRAEANKVFYDSDGDGIYDDVDIDDDNDGISDSDEENACRVSNGASQADYKFLNETFGTGIGRGTGISSLYTVSTTYTYENGAAGGGAGSVGDGKYTVASFITDGVQIAAAPNGVAPNGPEIAQWAWYAWGDIQDHTPGDTDGRMAIFNASHDPGIFYETQIKGTLANVPVTYSFWVVNLDNADNRFSAGELPRRKPDVTVNFYTLDKSVLLATFNTGEITRCPGAVNDPNDPAYNPLDPTFNTCVVSQWKQFTQQFTTSQTAFVVQFVNNAPGGNGNDLAIDDIEVRQTLCDMDGDGVADVFDLDSDNDGIPDVVEANTTAAGLSEGKGHLTGIASWADANGNGMLDILESLSTIDTDGDGIPDYLDLDSDNDGLFDVDESGTFNSNNPYPGFINGDGDITGDGTGDGPESETFREKDSNGDGSIEGYGDGILDIYDFHQGNTNYTNSYGNDNQGTGPLYALDSDGDGLPDYRDPYNDLTGIYDIDTIEIYAHLPNTGGVLDDITDADGDGIMASRDGDDTVFGSPRNLDASYSLYFDGRNDYVEDVNIIPSGDATLMAFIKTDGANTNGNNQIIAGQNDLYLRLNDATNTISAVVEGTTITSTNAITDGVWTHVAVTTQGGQTVLYINGVQEASDASGGITDASNFSIGKATSGTNYFKGEIDEVRVFNVALTSDELKRMVYQELDDLNGFNSGKIIPTNISASIGTNLVKYYKMDGYQDDILDDKKTGTLDVAGARMYNFKDIYFQRAPLPYETVADGDWTNTASWLNGSEWDIMSKQNNPQDATIIHIKHNIIMDGTYNTQGTVGIIVDAGNEFSITANKGLYNSFYLKLDGFMDLDGESQLIQTSNSILDVTSSGRLERDQQGTRDFFTYNYWSSPVGISNTTTNNNSYRVPNVLRDGSVSTAPVTINFLTSGYNGNPGTPGVTPISIADYWIWKYSNRTSNTYSQWQHVRSTGTLLAGEGFTMKGVANTSGAITLQQNYTFNGKPNNGDITLAVTAGNDYLIGNPYPSAIDANEFILDNISVGDGGRAATNIINGALYFWDHFASNTHVLAEYQGGYAIYNLLTSTVAVSNDTRIANTGAIGGKTAERYIPVSQGFFVVADDGGTVTFKNSQRDFRTEASDPSLFIKPKNDKSKNSTTKESQTDTRQKIKLMFDSPKGYHRQLAVGVDEKASNEFDLGYDAPLIEDLKEDMFWIINDGNYVIQGVDNFDDTQKLPMGIKTNKAGISKIKLDALENISNDLDIYLIDKELGIQHNLKESNYEVYLLPGSHINRFEITFKNSESQSLDTDDIVNKTIQVYFSNEKGNIVIHNPTLKQIKSVEIINLLGQTINKFSENTNKDYMEYETNKMSTGVYLIKIQTPEGSFSKKVLIK
ncbi:LamG-like jellyroll fold domain-containing protein [Confluentibacter lentus]|uniref:LamG-like jellyroll fold domain-containing protein n=1 Tax=Confluentibacter lentus TaxID=1699412 RepID=UPI0012FD922F|nr:LamG-like jellyroll fold domain-containing protein [Confluentibacter lentus]